MVGIVPFFTMSAQCTYLSGMGKRKNRYLTIFDCHCLGHRKGVHGEELLDYLTARKLIYLPCYKWVLENKLQKLVAAIRIISKNKPVVLLDYNTNPDVNNPKSPLSHASLIKAYIEGNYPE